MKPLLTPADIGEVELPIPISGLCFDNNSDIDGSAGEEGILCIGARGGVVAIHESSGDEDRRMISPEVILRIMRRVRQTRRKRVRMEIEGNCCTLHTIHYKHC